MSKIKIRLTTTVNRGIAFEVKRELEVVMLQFGADYDIHTEQVSEKVKDPTPETKEEWLARDMDDPEPPPEEVEEQRMAEAEAKEDR